MKNAILLLILLSILSASSCESEDDDCHYSITIKNNSSSTVISGTVQVGVLGCRMSGNELPQNNEDEFSPYNSCIENRMQGEITQEIYIVDPSGFNPENEYYDCDSVEARNTILKKYVLTLEDLRESNFIINYP